MFTSPEISQTVTMLFSTYASLTGFIMMFRSVFNDLIPDQLRSYVRNLIESFFAKKSKESLTLIIDEDFGSNSNQVFKAAETYLRTKVGPKNERLRIGKSQRQKHLTVTLDRGEEISDNFENIELNWKLIEKDDKERYYEKYYEITFERKFRDRVIDFYLPHVLAKADEINKNHRIVKLHSKDLHHSVDLEHPSTFETLAMDSELKKMIIDDLNRFVSRREFYKRVGKAWKRGYLLYGPPGTGKSSLIAAMANYLKFDVYDLELTSVYSNKELKSVLLSVANQSIVVIEDIDCSKQVKDRDAEDSDSSDGDERVTLSGILNSIDGLWSSCADERIIIFTTNHKDRLDPALLRPGRMDVHINLSYCTIQGFRVLVPNYLGLDGQNHPLCEEIERLIETTEVTPAEIAEELMKDDDVDVVLGGLLKFVEKKKGMKKGSEQKEEGKKGDEEKKEISESKNGNNKASACNNNNKRKGRKRRGKK